jgi:hypothetical protein
MVAQNFVVGEALIKFVGGSEGYAAVEQSMQTSPPNLATLGPVLGALQIHARIPFKAIRLDSGAWILLKIEADQVAQQAADSLRTHAEFGNVTLVSMESDPYDRETSPKALLVNLATGNQAADSGDLQAQTSSLATELGLPIIVSIREKKQLLIEINWKELTHIFVERLKSFRDVEAAQPNYILGIRPPS